jgi:hypothetical protein
VGCCDMIRSCPSVACKLCIAFALGFLQILVKPQLASATILVFDRDAMSRTLMRLTLCTMLVVPGECHHIKKCVLYLPSILGFAHLISLSKMFHRKFYIYPL